MPTAKIDISTATTAAIVSAVPGRTIRVMQYTLIANDEVVVTWKSGTTAITGPITLIKGTPLVALTGTDGYGSSIPLLESSLSEALNLTLNGAVQVSGHITYEVRG